MKKDIYKKLYVGPDEFPLLLWFSETYKEDEDPAWPDVSKFLASSDPTSYRKYTLPEIEKNICYLVENVFEKIGSRKNPQEAVYTYYPSDLRDKGQGHNSEWKFLVHQVGVGIQQSLPSLLDIRRNDPSWWATVVMEAITEKYLSVLGETFKKTFLIG